MRVTDAQIHIWDGLDEHHLDRGVYDTDVVLADMEKAEVDRVVLVPVKISGDAAKDNAYCFEAARLHPDKIAVMARIVADHPDAPAYLDEMVTMPGMKGLRLHLASEAWESMDWMWPTFIENGLTAALFAGRGAFDRLVPILDNFPDLKVFLDHVAVPYEKSNPFGYFDRVLELEKYPNVTVKVSALTRYSQEKYPFSDLHPYIKRLHETFGPERLAWGSDYSVHAQKVTYRETVDLIRVACDFLSASDREWILDKTLSRVLNWE